MGRMVKKSTAPRYRIIPQKDRQIDHRRELAALARGAPARLSRRRLVGVSAFPKVLPNAVSEYSTFGGISQMPGVMATLCVLRFLGVD
jgi:hypothetical protein